MKMFIKTFDLVNSSLWRMFPVINVDRVKDIPCDYPGAMGVPITFMDKYSPGQFEILGITKSGARLEDGRQPYRRVILRNLKPQLPDEADLMELLKGAGVEVEIIEVSEVKGT